MFSGIGDLGSVVFLARGVTPFEGPLCLAEALDMLLVAVRVCCCWEAVAIKVEEGSRGAQIDG
jgi:hypothetical protein